MLHNAPPHNDYRFEPFLVRTTCPDKKGIRRINGEEWIDSFTLMTCIAKEDTHSSSWNTKIVACLTPDNSIRFNVGTSITLGK